MLITPKLYNAEQLALYDRLYKMHGLSVEAEDRFEIVQDGIIYAGLNFDHDLSTFQKINRYSNFGEFPEWLINIRARTLSEDPENARKKADFEAALAEKARHPKEDLFKRDGWNHMLAKHNAEYAYMLDDGGIIPEFEYHLNSYGVCDTVEQLLSMYDFEADPRALCIIFTPILKKDQSEDGGWRWHKWGPYLGTHTPTTEYLYDEEDIDGVLIYHIYEIVDETDEEMFKRERQTEERFERIRKDVEAFERGETEPENEG